MALGAVWFQFPITETRKETPAISIRLIQAKPPQIETQVSQKITAPVSKPKSKLEQVPAFITTPRVIQAKLETKAPFNVSQPATTIQTMTQPISSRTASSKPVVAPSTKLTDAKPSATIQRASLIMQQKPRSIIKAKLSPPAEYSDVSRETAARPQINKHFEVTSIQRQAVEVKNHAPSRDSVSVQPTRWVEQGTIRLASPRPVPVETEAFNVAWAALDDLQATANPAPPASIGEGINLGALRKQYESEVAQKVQSSPNNYPTIARRRGYEGEPIVAFTLGKNGDIIDLSVHRSSQIRVLDEAALQTIEKLRPFPPIPEPLQLSSSQFIFKITYLLPE